MKEFGTTIRQLREKKGLLLRQVAAELDIDTALLSKVERGLRHLKKDQVMHLAEIIEEDKKILVVLWLSGKIDSLIKREDFASEALALSLQKLSKNK